jgi:hypothetical protein
VTANAGELTPIAADTIPSCNNLSANPRKRMNANFTMKPFSNLAASLAAKMVVADVSRLMHVSWISRHGDLFPGKPGCIVPLTIIPP